MVNVQVILGFGLLWALGITAFSIVPSASSYQRAPNVHATADRHDQLRPPNPPRCTTGEVGVTRVTVTAYSIGDGFTPGTEVALGGRVWVGTVAVSRDMLHLLGHRIMLRGWCYVVRDTMGPQAKQHIDVYMDSVARAVQFGVQSGMISY